MFSCTTKECIDQASICDGLADCSDKSDETQSLCAPLFKTYDNKLIHFKELIKYKIYYILILSVNIDVRDLRFVVTTAHV